MNNAVNKTGLRSRRGVTVAEVAIALVIIAIISGTAVGLILNSVKVEANFVAVTQTQTSAENVLECFRFSDNPDTFLQTLQTLGAYEFDSEQNAYILTGKTVNVTVKASFAPKKLEYTAVKSNGEEIYSYTFPVEGGAAS